MPEVLPQQKQTDEAHEAPQEIPRSQEEAIRWGKKETTNQTPRSKLSFYESRALPDEEISKASMKLKSVKILSSKTSSECV